VTAVYHERI